MRVFLIEFYCFIYVVEKTFNSFVYCSTALLNASSYAGFVLKLIGMTHLTIYGKFMNILIFLFTSCVNFMEKTLEFLLNFRKVKHLLKCVFSKISLDKNPFTANISLLIKSFAILKEREEKCESLVIRGQIGVPLTSGESLQIPASSKTHVSYSPERQFLERYSVVLWFNLASS